MSALPHPHSCHINFRTQLPYLSTIILNRPIEKQKFYTKCHFYSSENFDFFTLPINLNKTSSTYLRMYLLDCDETRKTIIHEFLTSQK
jgi:hypothetical protein